MRQRNFNVRILLFFILHHFAARQTRLAPIRSSAYRPSIGLRISWNFHCPVANFREASRPRESNRERRSYREVRKRGGFYDRDFFRGFTAQRHWRVSVSGLERKRKRRKKKGMKEEAHISAHEKRQDDPFSSSSSIARMFRIRCVLLGRWCKRRKTISPRSILAREKPALSFNFHRRRSV